MSSAPEAARKPLTPAQKAAAVQAELASRILSRRSLLQFTKRLNPKYSAGWVHHDVCRRLEKFSDDVIARKSPRLLLMMPPRHGKSELASKNFPAWHLGRRPDHEFISCSYNLSLAMTFSRKVKMLLGDPAYQTVFETRLDPNNQSTEEWGLDSATGGFVAAGIGGGITGKGAHILSIDDPLKSAEDADSADTREKLWDWYGSTAYTRLAPGGGVLVIQTCWHDDDLAGRLQAAMRADPDADQFEIVKYPAIAEAHEYLDEITGEIVRVNDDTPINVLGTEFHGWEERALRASAYAIAQGYDLTNAKLLRLKGDPLHAERYGLKALNQTKKTLPVRFWAALYQQNPTPEDGQYFLAEQFRRAPMPNKATCNVSIAFDFAISTKTQNDYTVGSVGLQDSDDMIHVAEMIRFKSSDAFFIVEQMIDLAVRWSAPTLQLGVEDGQIWRSIEAVLRRRMRERRVHFVIKILKPLTDKRARASVLQARMQQQMVRFNEVGGWYDVARAELLRFDNGTHDDCVDSLGWMARLTADRSPPKKVGPPPILGWKDRMMRGAHGVSHMAA